MLSSSSTIAGNIGWPLSDAATRSNITGVVVLELSSYQLEYLTYGSFDCVVFTNFSWDHQERHHSIQRYFEAKWSLFRRVKIDGTIVTSQSVLDWARKFSLELPAGITPILIDKLDDPTITSSFEGNGRVRGAACERNGLAAAKSAEVFCQNPLKEIIAQLSTYEKLPFRQIKYLSTDNLEVINDSKSTNLSSTIAALDSLTKPAILMLGGRSKNEDFGELSKYSERFKPFSHLVRVAMKSINP